MQHYKIIFIKYSDIKKSLFRLFFHKVIFLIKKRTNLQSISLFFGLRLSLQDDSTPRVLSALNRIAFKGREERDSAPLAYAHVRLICSIHSQFLRYTRPRPKSRFESLFR